MYNLKQLYLRFLNKECTREEAGQFITFFNEHGFSPELDEMIMGTLEESGEQLILLDEHTQVLLQNKKAIHNLIQRELDLQKDRSIRLLRGLITSAAAVLILGLCFILFKPDSWKNKDQVVTSKDIQPGYNQAILTLDDGQTINLSKNKTGILMHANHIIYQDGSKLTTSSGIPSMLTKQSKLTLHTPKGGVYQVQLDDGTKVWLNASSTLIYPPEFSDKERIVELIGEGYFEVTKNASKPFKVISKGQIVEVLGTSFNISAYPDDRQTTTTLVTGKVSVHSAIPVLFAQVKTLAPGQEAVLENQGIQVRMADFDTSLDWKNGVFSFYETDIKQVLKKLGRWYNFELEFKAPLPSYFLSGEIERNKNLSEVLGLLKESGLQFQIIKTGGQQKLIIMP